MDIQKLPDHRIQAQWLDVNALDNVQLEAVHKWRGKINRIDGALHVVDVSYWPAHVDNNGPHSAKIAKIADHPFLSKLNAMPHVPRAVKAIYRKEVRLKHLMAMDAWDVMSDVDKAHKAWSNYAK